MGAASECRAASPGLFWLRSTPCEVLAHGPDPAGDLRPLAILMLIVGLVLMGAVSYTRMKVDRFPAISFPAVFVSIPYPGAAPTDVEELVAKPVENAVAGLAGIETITSTSNEGSASLNIQLRRGRRHQPGRDGRRAAHRRRYAAPAGRHRRRLGHQGRPSALPIMNIALSGDRSRSPSCSSSPTTTILPKLQSVDGVADVTISGGLQREIQVKVDPQRLRAYGISLQTVQTALAARERQHAERSHHRGRRVAEHPGMATIRTLERAEESSSTDDPATCTGPDAGDRVARSSGPAPGRRRGRRTRPRADPVPALQRQGRGRLLDHQAGRREQHPGRRQRQGGARARFSAPAARRQDDDHQRHVGLHAALARRRSCSTSRPGGHPDGHRAAAVPAHLAQHVDRPAGDPDLADLDLPGDVLHGLQPEHHLADGAGADDRHPGRRLDRRAREHLPPPGARRGAARRGAQAAAARSAWPRSRSRWWTWSSSCRSAS